MTKSHIELFWPATNGKCSFGSLFLLSPTLSDKSDKSWPSFCAFWVASEPFNQLSFKGLVTILPHSECNKNWPNLFTQIRPSFCAPWVASEPFNQPSFTQLGTILPHKQSTMQGAANKPCIEMVPL